ncbi:hypothetical protein [Prescottella subtropica]|uniref:hypothetical protein n=1 Tax=Prescottella subtropica TaxID=2545757 RepID=UPI0010F82E48|nr:hypothetical protein [Prescottella subtropica]
MAREHRGAGRCGRCGFLCTAQVRSCPTARRIAAELESRGRAPVTLALAGRGLCAGKGRGWTVTGCDPEPWRRAMAACEVCPILAQCTALLDRRSARERPLEQVIAGRLFSGTGKQIPPDRIERFAAARGYSKPASPKTPAPTPTPEPRPIQISTSPRQLHLFELMPA